MGRRSKASRAKQDPTAVSAVEQPVRPESRRARWAIMAVAWIGIAAVLAMHAVAIRDYLSIVGARGLRGRATIETPFKMAYLPGAVDAQEWVQHANSLLNGKSIQLRHTNIDNAPDGREVHWNSAWAWTIAGAGWLHHTISGNSLASSLEAATIWLNPVVLFALIILVSSFATRRAGVIAGLVVAVAMLGHRHFYVGFEPNYVDHHGLLTAAAFGLVLGAVFMGAGWWTDNSSSMALIPRSREAARSAAVVSAVSGALGMWVSAASAIPPIAMVGVAGVLATAFAGRDAVRDGLHFDASVWRLWGRVGAVTSFVFYLVEYFPMHLGMRLEANHPLYSLAWLGAGELIGEWCERWVGPVGNRWQNPVRLLAPLGLVLVAPLTIAIARTAVFTPLDPFLARFYSAGLLEFTPIWKLTDSFSLNPYVSIVGIENLPLVVAVVLLFMGRGRASPLLWFATVATGAFTIMAWTQMRWLSNASGPQIALTLVLLTVLTANRRRASQWYAAVATCVVLFVPDSVIRIVRVREDIAQKNVPPRFDMFVMYRDIADVLRATQPSGDITLLANPNESLSLGYYGQFKSIGTGFWENLAGLKASAEMFTAPTADSAATLIRAHRVTHVMMVEGDDFVGPAYALLHANASRSDMERTFGYRLLYKNEVPQWLQAIPYSEPDDLAALGAHVHLFRVNFEQSSYDARYQSAMAAVARGDDAHAEQEFDALIRENAASYLPWLGKARLLVTKQRWDSAATVALTAVARAPQSERADLYASFASAFLQARQPAPEVRMYRAMLAERFDPQVACLLTFVLASSRVDSVRNGAEAVTLARRALATSPDSPAFLNCLAMALAETGRFAEAIASANQAASKATATGDTEMSAMASQLLEAFRAGRPWRD